MSKESTQVSRRKFLTASAMGLAGAGLVNLPVVGALAQSETEPAPDVGGKLITRTLGRTGMELPIVSLGAGGCQDPAVVAACYEAGIRHYDTAANYQFGANEQMIGGVFAKMGVRDKVNIGTKIYTPAQRRNLTAAQAKKRLMSLTEGSLKRLRTDYVDILYIHVLDNRETTSDEVIMEAMADIKKQGKARALGISTHANMTEVIDEAAKVGFWDVILTSVNFTMADDNEFLSAIDRAAKAGIGIIGMKVMAGGTPLPNPDSRQQHSSSVVAAAAQKWVLNNPNITTIIPAFNSNDLLQENVAVARNPEMTEDEKRFLSDNQIILGMGFCRGCQKCLASCPKGSDIPSLMRSHMYAMRYGDVYMARHALDEIPGSQGLNNCSTCQACTAQCVRSVPIRDRVGDLVTMYA